MLSAKSSFLFGAFVVFFLASCAKDKTPPADSECALAKHEGPSFGIDKSERYEFGKPCFNPNNGNEFIYQYRDFETKTIQLIKYNLLSKTKTVLLENYGVLISQPQWGTNGTIAFDSYPSYHIWTIKDDGTGLTQRSIGFTNIYPVWDADGSNLYWQYSENLGNPYYFVRLNMNTLKIDTLWDKHTGYSTISKNNILATQSYLGDGAVICTSPLPEMNISQQVVLGVNDLTGMCWHPNNKQFYFAQHLKGLKVFDMSNNKITELLMPCARKYYRTISCSPDGKKLIAERIDARSEFSSEGKTTGNIINKSSVYLIDLQTLEEREVYLH